MFRNDVLIRNARRSLKKVSERLAIKQVAVVDQYDAQPFNVNDVGTIRNDISALARAQSKSEFDMILARLNVTPDDKSLPKELTDKDALKLVRSRYCQSPLELEQYAAQLASYDSARLDAAYRESVKDVKVDNVETEQQKID